MYGLYMTNTKETLQRTPLYASHVELGARMVSFGGWEMPVEYTGISEEHIAVRTTAGLFDVSHMGEIEIAGDQALAAVQRISCNNADKLQIGQAQYSGLLTSEGTFVDDLLVYRLASDHFMLVVNAANIQKDYQWIKEHISALGDAVAVNASSRYGLLAVQGPGALEVVQTLTSIDLADISYYWFVTGELANERVTISRTGYTGEDGVEIFVAPQSARKIWTALLESGQKAGLKPAGLGARDTLRLESAMRLYGQDITDQTTALEAGLGWIVGWDKEGFIGDKLLRLQKTDGVSRRLVGFEMVDRGIARHGYAVYAEGVEIGIVTSGTHAPSLKKAIGMAYVQKAYTAIDTEFQINIRGKRVTARVVRMPFYKRREAD